MVNRIDIGTDLIEDIKNYDVILVGTSIKNTLSNGFQKKIAVNFRQVMLANLQTRYDDPRKLGTCKVVNSYQKQGFPTFVLCYITKGRYRPDIKPDALDYEAVRSCVNLVNEHFKGKKIGSTLLGNSKYEGGGNADKIYDIFVDSCDDIDLYIYDYEQEDYYEETNKIYRSIIEDRNNDLITRGEYEEKMKKYLWEEAFGIYGEPPPEGLTLYETRRKIKEIKNNW